MARDIFNEIRNAVLDLQMAQLQSFERPFKQLAKLLNDPLLEHYNAALTEGVDLQAFLEKSQKTGGSMIGSQRLIWPDDRKQQLGLTLLLIQWLSAESKIIASFCYQYFYAGKSMTSGIRAFTSQVLIPFVRDYESYVRSSGAEMLTIKPNFSKRVFVVHGHDEGARESVARFLERVGLEPVILHEQASRGRTVIEKVEANSDVGFAVVLLTPDDEGRTKRADGTLQPRVRQNVLLELGYFIGKLGRDRVCALLKGAPEIPSDFAGVVWEQFDDGGGWRQRLAKELQAAGYIIDWNLVMGATDSVGGYRL